MSTLPKTATCCPWFLLATESPYGLSVNSSTVYCSSSRVCYRPRCPYVQIASSPRVYYRPRYLYVQVASSPRVCYKLRPFTESRVCYRPGPFTDPRVCYRRGPFMDSLLVAQGRRRATLRRGLPMSCRGCSMSCRGWPVTYDDCPMRTSSCLTHKTDKKMLLLKP